MKGVHGQVNMAISSDIKEDANLRTNIIMKKKKISQLLMYRALIQMDSNNKCNLADIKVSNN